MSKQSTQSVILKVLYTIDNQSNLNFLARSPKPISIKTVELPINSPHNAGLTIGLIDLRKCLELISNNSPELFTLGSSNSRNSGNSSNAPNNRNSSLNNSNSNSSKKSNTRNHVNNSTINTTNNNEGNNDNDDHLNSFNKTVDFSIYSKDVVEPDEPFVGHGLYSKIVSKKQTSSNSIIIAGRICKNFLNLYSNNNNSNVDTLEIRLKLNEIIITSASGTTASSSSMNQNKKRSASNDSSELENSSPTSDENQHQIETPNTVTNTSIKSSNSRKRRQTGSSNALKSSNSNSIDNQPLLASRTQSLPFFKNTMAHRIMLADLNSMESQMNNSSRNQSPIAVHDRFSNFDKLKNHNNDHNVMNSNAPIRAKRNKSLISQVVKVGDTPTNVYPSASASSYNSSSSNTTIRHPPTQCINCTSTSNTPFKFHKSGIYEFGNSGFLCSVCNSLEANGNITELRKRGKLGSNGLVDGPYNINNNNRYKSSKLKSDDFDYSSSPSNDSLLHSSSSPITSNMSSNNIMNTMKNMNVKPAPRRYYYSNPALSNNNTSTKNASTSLNTTTNTKTSLSKVAASASASASTAHSNPLTPGLDFDELNEFLNSTNSPSLNSQSQKTFLSPLPRKKSISSHHNSTNNGASVATKSKSMMTMIHSDDDIPNRSSVQMPLTDIDPIYHHPVHPSSSSSSKSTTSSTNRSTNTNKKMLANVGLGGLDEYLDNEGDDELEELDINIDDEPINATKLATTLIDFGDEDEDKENLPPLEEEDDENAFEQSSSQSLLQNKDQDQDQDQPQPLYHTDISPTLNKILQSISELSDSNKNGDHHHIPNSPSNRSGNHNDADDVANNWISLFTNNNMDEEMHFTSNTGSNSNTTQGDYNDAEINRVLNQGKDLPTPSLKFDKTPKDIITPKDTPSLNQSTTPTTGAPSNIQMSKKAKSSASSSSSSSSLSNKKAAPLTQSKPLQRINMPSSPFFLISNDNNNDQDQDNETESNTESSDEADQEGRDMVNVTDTTSTSIHHDDKIMNQMNEWNLIHSNHA